MSEALTERFEMRLSDDDGYKLKFINDCIGAGSKAAVIRQLIKVRYLELLSNLKEE